MKENSPNKLMLGHLNINYKRNKLEFLEDVINRNLDIILLSETKLDDSFLSAQFILKGYGVPYRFDMNSKGGGLLFYIRKDVTSKFFKLRSDNCNIESICVEINLRKRKWSILHPLKTPENRRFSGVFRGYKMGTLAGNGLMVHTILIKASYQIILSVLIASLMNTAKGIKISCFWMILMPPQMKSARKSFVKNSLD